MGGQTGSRPDTDDNTDINTDTTTGTDTNFSALGVSQCLAPLPERPVEVKRGADQAQVRKRLRKVAQRFTVRPGLFGVKAQVVRVTEYPLEDEARLLELLGVGTPGARAALRQARRYTC